MSKTKALDYLRKVGQVFYIFLCRWGIILAAAFLLAWYLQYRTAGNNADAVWTFLDEKPVIFWYNALFILLVLILFYGLILRPFSAIGVVFALITIITYISNTKLGIRGVPLLPEDLQLADQTGELTSFVDMGEVVRLILATILSIGLGIMLDYLTKARLSYFVGFYSRKKKLRTKKEKIRKKHQTVIRGIYYVTARITLVLLSIFAIGSISSPIVHHDGKATQTIDWLDANLTAWNPTYTYSENGFIIGFLYNLGKFELVEPNNYSKATIAEIKKTYQSEAEKDAAGKTSLDEADYNIVVILNESYFDMSLLQSDYPYTGGDNLPVFHSLMKKYPSGYMYSTEYGGGTANVEFEVDTGLSNYWAQTVPYTDLLPKIDRTISMANDAKAAGYQTTAIHSYVGGMYKRNFALAKEGFDTFITQDEMTHQDHDGASGWISDDAIYNETVDVLKNSSDKQFISVITMQNHTPYYRSNYNEIKFELSAFDDIDPNYRDIIIAYMQSVYNADAYLGKFLDNLSKLDEKTVVLFYGDHAPGLFTYNNQGLTKLVNLTHLTPYFIWYNFDVKDSFSNQKYGQALLGQFGGAYEELHPESDDELEVLSKDVTLPTTTPNCLTNTLYGVLNLKQDAEIALLNKVCAEIPILSATYLGEKIPSGKAVTDYQLLNYDILGGKRHWFSSL